MEKLDLNKLREMSYGKSGEEVIAEFKKMKGGSEAITAEKFSAMSPEDQQRVAEEYDTNPKAFLSHLEIREAARGADKI